MPAATALIEILLDPSRLPGLPPELQTQLIRQARQAGLLGYLNARIAAAETSGKLSDHLLAAKVQADYNEQMISWETDRLGRVLNVLPGPVILLKGAAYKALDLGLSQGRLASDVDLLLPREQLPAAEQRLLSAGWEPLKEDQYEQHYYRQWMHELPPLRHRERGTVVDLHHAILPPTARLKPDPARLIASALPMQSGPFYTLCPEDAVIHRATHLFYDGDLHNSLRELVDIHELLTLYTADSDFLLRLIERARVLDLARPLYYALWSSSQLLGSAVPDEVVDAAAQDAPSLPVRRLMQWLITSQLIPADPDVADRLRAVAGSLLFVRSHWLRMPPLMLARHLLTQVWRRGGIKTG